jgi:hypothetical protein
LHTEALHVPLPRYSEVRIESAELSNTAPTEYRADLVVLLIDGKPVLGIIVDVQLKPDEHKRWVWPVYVSGSRARPHDCLSRHRPMKEFASPSANPLMNDVRISHATPIAAGMTIWGKLIAPFLMKARYSSTNGLNSAHVMDSLDRLFCLQKVRNLPFF